MLGVVLLAAIALAMTASGRRADLLMPTAKRCVLECVVCPVLWCAPHVRDVAARLGALLRAGAEFPIAWPSFGRDGAWGVSTISAAVCYVALARMTIGALLSNGHGSLVAAITMISWVALLPGMLGYVIEQRRALEAAA